MSVWHCDDGNSWYVALVCETSYGEFKSHSVTPIEAIMKVVPFGPQDGAKFNIAVQRPTVNLKEAENVGEQAQASTHLTPRVTFSKHASFGPRATTHPGLED